jgi:thiol-disulfide isomerase/thioredoxin
MKTFEHTDELDIFMNDHSFIIIQVSAAWCKPCKSISPYLEKYIQELKCNNSFLFLKCDYDIISEFQSFIDTYEVEKIPYFIFLEYGAMKSSYSGSNMDHIQNIISDYVIRNTRISNDSFLSTDF